MIKQIRSFPSEEFYGNSLEDGDGVKLQTVRDWHEYRCFGPFSFFDIHEGEEAKPIGKGSWINVAEVDFVLLLYQKLVTLYPGLKSGNQVAIISPYRQQVMLFQQRFEETFGVSAEKLVDICTVDGCQVNLLIWLNQMESTLLIVELYNLLSLKCFCDYAYE